MPADLADRSQLRAVLERHGVWAKKRLSQNFLCSAAVVRAILGELQGMRGALEIGPGPGVLTQGLCEVCERVLAVELDPEFVPILHEQAPCAQVLVEDVLKADWPVLLGSLPRPRALVSNLPYQITGPLLALAAEHAQEIDLAVLMMQREVAERVLAPPGVRERGAISVLLQAAYHVAHVCDVPPGAFLPPPKVTSTVVRFVPKAGPPNRDLHEFVRKCFRAPRKTIENNLVQALGASRADARRQLEQAGIDPSARPQTLDLEQWRRLWDLTRAHTP